MPCDYTKYPPNWKTEIRPRILERADHKCEECAAENYQAHPITGSRVVLTIAHLDHDPDNWEVTDDRLKALCQKCHFSYDRGNKLKGVSTGRFANGRFANGHIPDNKGKKWEEYLTPEQIKKVSKTTFKKGHIPKNKLPIGSEVLSKDGYIWRKIADPKLWEAKHRILYEEYHQIKIPDDKIVTFLDGDMRNFSIDNLALITRDENRILNINHLRFNDKDLTKTGLSIAKLKAAIYKKEREN